MGYERYYKRNYDRNAQTIIQEYSSSLAGHAWTTRYTYTIPSGKMAFHNLISGYISKTFVDPGDTAQITWFATIDGSEDAYGKMIHTLDNGLYVVDFIRPTGYYLAAGDSIRTSSKNDDSINHSFSIVDLLFIFDEL